ncbi:MAG: SpoIIE family protein phosphatase [Clostridia bacterium]|nr:SpoIIE family protein phosphatase [Clostridia bacterium]
MKSFFKRLDYISVIGYLFLFASFLVFNQLEKTTLPYSSAILVGALTQGVAIIPTVMLYLSAFLVVGSAGLLGSQAIFAFLFAIITFIYRRFNSKMRLEMTAYAIVGLLGFVFLGDTSREILIEKRLITAVICVALTFLSVISAKALNEKGLKYKFGFEEIFSVAVLIALGGTGVCNLVSHYVWRALSVFIILALCFICRTGISTIISSVLGISLALYFGDIKYVSLFLVWSLASVSFAPLSRFVSAVAIIIVDYFLQLIFGIYGGYVLADFLSVLIGAVAFCLIPTKILRSIKEKLYSFRERQLVRQTINRNRLVLSGKLYDLSGVFTEMAGAFDAFKKNGISEEKAKTVMEKQIVTCVCTECEFKNKCQKKDKDFKVGLSKTIDIGFAKGKLSLIDLPKGVGDVCLRPNSIIFGLNKLLADFRSYALDNANLNSGRDIIASQALGVAEILRGLAIESGTTLKYHNRTERALSDTLFKKGFSATELLIYGEDERLSVSMITAMKEFSVKALENCVSETLGYSMELIEKTQISEDKCYLCFKHSTPFDAVYGLARTTKDGSEKCGDTYSVTRICEDRLLIALSDGMGSGVDAENISSASLSLIESFYKAGLSSPLILGTVNKLLSINTEDTFTALDVSVIDLKTCSADFIKYGSPYGFILGEKGIKIVEGNSLPLGIIDELKPSVCTSTLSDGDIVLLLSDGISDAFGSSGEIIDFLRLQVAKNPQTLADNTLNKAVELNGGIKKDDMTALAIRIFKRKLA